MKPKKSPPRNKTEEASVTFLVRIQPRARKNEFMRMDDGSLKIKLIAPPVDGAANEALVTFLADYFGASRSQVEIVSGHTSREKIVRIEGVRKGEAERLLNSNQK
ncbi:MAG TPA: DUF167 domain-containing protein [Nitrospirota bacterium]|nr:DUF167 domain-containing protein [Nitrospirota bacterium]